MDDERRSAPANARTCQGARQTLGASQQVGLGGVGAGESKRRCEEARTRGRSLANGARLVVRNRCGFEVSRLLIASPGVGQRNCVMGREVTLPERVRMLTEGLEGSGRDDERREEREVSAATGHEHGSILTRISLRARKRGRATARPRDEGEKLERRYFTDTSSMRNVVMSDESLVARNWMRTVVPLWAATLNVFCE